MLSRAGLAQRRHPGRAQRFFSKGPWSTDSLGLRLAKAIGKLRVRAGVAILILVADNLIHRTGPKLDGALWCPDGSATGPEQIRFGNCFVVAGVIVWPPFAEEPLALPPGA